MGTGAQRRPRTRQQTGHTPVVRDFEWTGQPPRVSRAVKVDGFELDIAVERHFQRASRIPPEILPANGFSARQPETEARPAKIGIGVARFVSVAETFVHGTAVAARFRPAQPHFAGAGEAIIAIGADVVVKEEKCPVATICGDFAAVHRRQPGGKQRAVVLKKGGRRPFAPLSFEGKPVELLVREQEGVAEVAHRRPGEGATHHGLALPIAEQIGFLVHANAGTYGELGVSGVLPPQHQQPTGEDMRARRERHFDGVEEPALRGAAFGPVGDLFAVEEKSGAFVRAVTELQYRARSRVETVSEHGKKRCLHRPLLRAHPAFI